MYFLPRPNHPAAAAAAGRIVIDGQLDDACWHAAAWTSEFTDIVGPQWGQPWFSTCAKIAWDDADLYIAAALGEPRAFANQTLHDRWVAGSVSYDSLPSCADGLHGSSKAC
jgi:hypothetical protein